MLKRSITTGSLLFIALGGILGSGWLFGPFYAAKIAGPAAILSWVIGGLLMIVIAMTFAELSSAFPISGGTARFLQLSHGTFISFTIAWIGWIAAAAVAPIETMALLQYTSNYFPQLMKAHQGVHLLTYLGMAVAAFLMLVMCFINALGAKFLTKTNNLVVLFKLFVPSLTLFLLFYKGLHIHNFTSPSFNPMGIKSILSALPAAGVIFSFIGYSPAIQLAGEVKNPQKSIPIAIIGALLITIFIYTLLQIVFVGALPESALSQGWAYLSFAGDTGPFAALVTTSGLGFMAYVLFLDASISPFGTGLMYTAATARIAYALGEKAYLPKKLMKVNKHAIPHRLLFLNFIIGLFLLLPFPSWQRLVGFLVASLVLSYAVGPLALPVLRKTLPDQPRPFQIPMPKTLCLLAFYICNLIIYWSKWAVVSKMLAFVLSGYVLLLFGKNKIVNIRHSWWIILYFILLGTVSYLGAFGGKHIITFGWDFLVIFALSSVVFALSQKYHVHPLEKQS